MNYPTETEFTRSCRDSSPSRSRNPPTVKHVVLDFDLENAKRKRWAVHTLAVREFEREVMVGTSKDGAIRHQCGIGETCLEMRTSTLNPSIAGLGLKHQDALTRDL